MLPEDHPLIQDVKLPIPKMLHMAKAACCHCSMCSEVCPRHLIGHRIEPNKTIRFASYGSLCDGSDTPMIAFLCSECRLCQYACIMNLQPWKVNHELKGIMAKQGIKSTLHNQPESVHPMREYKRFPIKEVNRSSGTDKIQRCSSSDRINNRDRSRIYSCRTAHRRTCSSVCKCW